MRLYLHQLRAEQRLFWRNREAAFFTFFLPVILFLLLGSIFGDETSDEGIKFVDYLLAGILGFGALSSAFAGLAITLVVRREFGVLKRMRSTPLPPATYVAAVLSSTFVVFAIEALLLIALARLAFDATLPGRPGSLALALALGTATFAALGVGMTALVRTAEGSSAVVNAVALPLAFISGSFSSQDALPGFLHFIGELFPLAWLIGLLQDIYIDEEAIWTRPGALAVIAAWGAGGLVIAVRGFRWEPRER